MAQLLGEIKINQFLEQIVAQFQLKQYTKDLFMYKFHRNHALCAIGYEKENKLFSKIYHFTVIIEKKIATSYTSKQEVHYSFSKRCWVSKKPNPLLEWANRKFLLDWKSLDFTLLKMTEEKGKRTFKMTMIPGSYMILLFPPLRQGISLYTEEIQQLQSLIDYVSNKLDDSDN